MGKPKFCNKHDNIYLGRCAVCLMEKTVPKEEEPIIPIVPVQKLRRNDESETLDKEKWNKLAKSTNSRISKRFA